MYDQGANVDNHNQTAVNHLLGKGGAYIATTLICLVIAGSALGNCFVAGRMTVAAANKTWFPAAFGTVGQIGTYKVAKSVDGNESADEAMDKGESPMYVPKCLRLSLSGLTLAQQRSGLQFRRVFHLHFAR